MTLENTIALVTGGSRGIGRAICVRLASMGATVGINYTNLGTQTMMCSDCHNTDAATPAAQGPHGSAAQFMLRGANAANWPNVTLPNRATSWCWNCHGTTTNSTHSA